MIRGSSSIAARFGVSALVIGLTVVSYGTSAPELAVNVKAAIDGSSDITIGNVIGSNIFNVLVILGISSLITPLLVQSQLIRFDVPLMIIVTIITYIFCLDGQISRLEGVFLLSGSIAYTVYSIKKSRQETESVRLEYENEYSYLLKNTLSKQIIILIAGIASMVIGAELFVSGAVSLARLYGLSELLIGLTIVAAGTSLPELATSAVAAYKGERDIAIGNVVGSNIFNLLFILGVTSIITPIQISTPAIEFDYPFMLIVTFICFPIFYTGFRIRRWEGLLFVSGYVAYIYFLYLQSRKSDDLDLYVHLMANILLPSVAVFLIGLMVLEWLKKKREQTHMY